MSEAREWGHRPQTIITALADNDPMYAVIRGTAVNQDGRTSGF